MGRVAALLFAMSAAGRLWAADLTFTGNARFLANTFINVRLTDGRVIDARLPKSGPLAAPSIVGRYKLADEVQISCKKIHPDLDLSVEDRYHLLELTQMRFLRTPTPEEVARVSASLVWQSGKNLLPPSAVAAPEPPPPPAVPEGFERIREVNLARVAAMPNFVADETATRSSKSDGSSKWRVSDTIESEIAFHGAEATRQRIRINGKPWSSPSSWLPGVNWGQGFGTDLRPLFKRDCANEITSEGRRQAQGRTVLAFRYHAPPDNCFGAGVYGYQSYSGEQTGRILVDESEGYVIQMEEHSSVKGPAESGGSDDVVLTWGDVKIGDATYLLPVAEDWSWHSDANRITWHVVVQYKNHRHFEAAATVECQGDPAKKAK